MAKPLRILIIDDDSIDRQSIKRSLQTAGIEAETTMAASAAAGISALQEQEFDCIFIDFKLPDMDGLELLQNLRKINAEVPVILVTSYGDERIAVEAIKQGASDYISKSLLSPEGISLSLRNTIRLSKIEKEKRIAEEKLRNTQSQLQTIIENTPLILWGMDQHGKFKFMTGKGLQMLGIDENKPVGKSFYEVFPESSDMPNRINQAMEGSLNKSTHEVKGIYFETLYQQMYDANGELSGLSGVSIDITDRIQSEKELKKAKELAEESMKVKEQFFTNISHEIRTPMNGIIGLSGVLQKTELTQEQRTYLDAIRISSERLLVIINDLLDFSKIEAGKISLEETHFNLRQLISQNISLLDTKARERENRLKVIVDPAVPDEICGDPVRLSQVLTNLIGNAIKFTEKGNIRVLVDKQEETSDSVTLDFEIQDNGIGIPDEKLATIFDSFTQASNDTTRKYGGTGLGLTISRQLIEMQGGKLLVRSKLGEGSTFSFNLKFSKALQKPAPEPEENLEIDPKELGKVRVLLAEDNEINQLLARKIITDWGFELDIAGNGRLAVDLLKQKDYDVVLMDMQMPEMDGYEATVFIRNEMGPKSNIPIIAFTAHATKTEIARCMLAGVNAYVSKPLKPNELLYEIYDLVKYGPIGGFIPELTPQEAGLTQELGEITIDLGLLKEMAGGNEAFLEEVLQTFITTTPESLTKMQEALEHQEWNTIAAIAHRLKSSMFLVGIKELEMNMATIEQSTAQPEDRARIEKLLNRTRLITDQAISKLKLLQQT